jgi:hypothetical protein
MNKKLFQHQENKTCRKKNDRKLTVMMSFISMIQGIYADKQGQSDHPGLKKNIMDDIDTKQRQAAHQQGQQGTMYGTSQRSGDTYCVPVYPEFHKSFQRYKKATLLQNYYHY